MYNRKSVFYYFAVIVFLIVSSVSCSNWQGTSSTTKPEYDTMSVSGDVTVDESVSLPRLITESTVYMDILDMMVINARYVDSTPRGVRPFNESGYYISKSEFLEKKTTIEITVISDYPVVCPNDEDGIKYGFFNLSLMKVTYGNDSNDNVIYSLSPLGYTSTSSRRIGSEWETIYRYSIRESSHYEIFIQNATIFDTSIEYSVYEVE